LKLFKLNKEARMDKKMKFKFPDMDENTVVLSIMGLAAVGSAVYWWYLENMSKKKTAPKKQKTAKSKPRIATKKAA
jgi:Flp pilus assembly protein TadB